MKQKSKKKIIVSVTNDLVVDNRVHKVCTTLKNMGFNVLLVGRKLPKSPPVNMREYQIKRFRLLLKKGPLFYAAYNLRLLLFLVFSSADILLANDLDTLPANFIASKIKKVPLVYDSHEYFTEVPELIDRPRVKQVWGWIEKKIVPKLEHAYTVCESIAKIYEKKYRTPFHVVRNVPYSSSFTKKNSTKKSSEKTLLYQGALNIGRGLEQAIRAMIYIKNAKLIIVGDGDIKSELEKLAENLDLNKKVKFMGRLPFEELLKHTSQADLGLSIEEDLGLNYRYALPNKLFDYIQAKVPVVVTNLPEMRAIVNRYQIGEVTNSLEPDELAKTIEHALTDEKLRNDWKKNLEIASKDLVWEKEQKTLHDIFSSFLKS